MAKFNIEVELDWLNDEEYSIDDEIREQVIDGVKNELLKRATDEALKELDSAIAEKLKEATNIIEQKVQDFIAVVTEKQIEKLKIPRKNLRGEVKLNLSLSESLSGNNTRNI